MGASAHVTPADASGKFSAVFQRGRRGGELSSRQWSQPWVPGGSHRFPTGPALRFVESCLDLRGDQGSRFASQTHVSPAKPSSWSLRCHTSKFSSMCLFSVAERKRRGKMFVF